jgi:V8-like Glu-specific endopeptidase
MKNRIPFILGIWICGCGAPEAPDGIGQRGEPIVGGTMDTADPAVGIISAAQGQFGGWSCTGTLISPTIFLTAGHCVQPADATTTFQVYFGPDQNSAIASDWVQVKEYHLHPQFNINNLPAGHDCAVLVLGAAQSTPSKPYNHDGVSDGDKGQPVRVVGYGLTVGGGTSFGQKRQLSTTIDGYTGGVIQIGQTGTTTCQGDSGGPMYRIINGVETIYGVTSYGENGCVGAASETRVDGCANWLDMMFPDTEPPTIAVSSPHAGDTVPSSFDIVFDAHDNLGVASIDVSANGMAIGTIPSGPWQYHVSPGVLPAGQTRIKATAKDAHGNQADSAEVLITVKRLGDTPGDLGASCSVNSDCTGDGFCANDNGTRFCSRLCATEACPATFTCETTPQFTQQCVPPKSDSGCAVSPHAPVGGLAALFALALLPLAARRRSLRRLIAPRR